MNLSISIVILLCMRCLFAVSIGADCARDPRQCGTPELEKLVCDQGQCKGGYLNNRCGVTSPCASSYFCNSLGICEACIEGCTTCSYSTTCSSTGCSLGYFYDTTLKKCVRLGSYCTQGTSSTLCTTCQSGYYLAGSKCLAGPIDCMVPTSATACTTCKTGMYWDEKTLSCKSGIANCMLAVSASECTTCLSGYYKSASGSCLKGPIGCLDVYGLATCKECKAGYWMDSLRKCIPYTTANCINGVNTTACISCSADYYLNKACSTVMAGCLIATSANTCSFCREGYYLDINNYCQPCYSTTKCKACTGALKANCKSCALGYFKVPIEGCLSCAANCKTCDTSGAGKCDACQSQYVVKGDKSGCDSCADNCDACGTSGAGKCDTCASGYILKTDNTACLSCAPDCATCATAGAGLCDKCKTGYVLVTPAKTCSACASNCDVCDLNGAGLCDTCSSGYKRNSGKLCDPCAPNCDNCDTAGAGKCDICESHYKVNKDSLLCEECISNCLSCTLSGSSQCELCAAGFYLSAMTKECRPNPLNCADALGTESCAKCNSGYTLGAVDPCQPCTSTNCGVCISQTEVRCTTCKSGYWKDPTALTCGLSMCTANCLKCASANTCETCADGFFISNHACFPCMTNCKQCSSEKYCSLCYPGFYLKDDSSCGACSGSNVATCTPPPKDNSGLVIAAAATTTLTCVEGSFTTPDCGPKVTGCISTNAPNKCTVCEQGYYLQADYTCALCQIANCLVCSTGSSCTACKLGYGPTHDSKNAITACLPCQSPCSTCSGTLTTCTSCIVGYSLNAFKCQACDETTIPGQCICPTGQYWKDTACANCMANCKTCKTASSCEQCVDNAYYTGSECQLVNDYNCKIAFGMAACKNCDFVTYTNVDGNDCRNCTIIPNCLSCSSSTTCTMCATGYYLTSGYCVSCSKAIPQCTACIRASICDMCSNESYWNVSMSACMSCIKGCNICSNSTNCMQCRDDYFMTSKSTCQSCGAACIRCANTTKCAACKDKFYLDKNGQCGECAPLCASCQNAGDAYCNTCIANASFTSNKTVVPATCSCRPGFLYSFHAAQCLEGSLSYSPLAPLVGVGLLPLLLSCLLFLLL